MTIHKPSNRVRVLKIQILGEQRAHEKTDFFNIIRCARLPAHVTACAIPRVDDEDEYAYIVF